MASSSGRQPNFAALNRGRHLCLAGRPSGSALAHILVVYNLHNIVTDFWATICKTVRPTLSDPCLSCPVLSLCLSVTLVYCGQRVAWIKVKLGTEVGLGPDHIVLDGVPVLPPKGAQPPIFGPYLLRPNGCMDHDVTW